jgi:pyruvate decarboxylase
MRSAPPCARRSPAYIDIACNISAGSCAPPGPISAVINEEPSDPDALQAAVDAAAEFLRGRQKPVILIGSKLRAAGAEKAAVELADALGCSVAVMAAAKSFFPEDHLVSVLIRASAIARVLRGCASTISGTCFSIVS